MSEIKTDTTRFILEVLPTAAGNSTQVKALHQRLQRADAQPIDYTDIAELADEWFLRVAREGKLANPLRAGRYLTLRPWYPPPARTWRV